MLCFYNTELQKLKIKEIILFSIATRRIKHFGINLAKGVKDLDTENHKTLLKETKEERDRWKDVHIHGLE